MSCSKNGLVHRPVLPLGNPCVQCALPWNYARGAHDMMGVRRKDRERIFLLDDVMCFHKKKICTIHTFHCRHPARPCRTSTNNVRSISRIWHRSATATCTKDLSGSSSRTISRRCSRENRPTTTRKWLISSGKRLTSLASSLIRYYDVTTYKICTNVVLPSVEVFRISDGCWTRRRHACANTRSLRITHHSQRCCMKSSMLRYVCVWRHKISDVI